MTYVAPLPKEAVTDPEMRELMAQGEALGVPDDLFPRIAARSPDLAKPFMRALLMSHAEGNVDHRLIDSLGMHVDLDDAWLAVRRSGF